MQVLVNSDHHITSGEDLTERVRGVVEGRLERFDGRITRVEVHLNDLNGSKLGERDKRAMMEARIGGMKPIAVSHEAPTLTEAIHVAADKLERAIGHALGKLEDTVGRAASQRAPAQGSSRSDERADMESAPGFREAGTAQRNARAGGPAATEGQWHGQASIEALQELERTEADPK